MNIVFCGTPDFALPALKALVDRGWVKAVVTQPGRPKGRGMKVSPSEVAVWAKSQGIWLFEPEKLSLIKQELLAIDIDILVVAAYGKMIPDWLLQHPLQGCVNIHASLLPRWRGAAPIHRALLAGDVEVGVSIMKMEKGLDTGGYWAQKSVLVTPDTKILPLQQTLAQLGSDALCEVLEKGLHCLPAKLQDETLVTYAEKVTAEDFSYQSTFTTLDIKRRLQAFYPKPGLRAVIGEDALRLIWSDDHAVYQHDHQPGTLLSLDERGLWIATVDGSLAITEIQLASQTARTVESMRFGWPKALALGRQLQSPLR